MDGKLVAGLGLSLFALWLLLSGHFSPLMLALGLISSGFCVWLAGRMGITDREGVPLHLGARVIVYLGWLVREVFITNLKVAKIILSPELPVNPVMFLAPAGQKSDLGRAIFANSITLTPGTITVEADDAGRHILVHALSAGMSWGEASCEMDRRVRALEGP